MIDLDFSPLNERLIFDSHSHYDDDRFADSLEEIMDSLSKNVKGIITCGCDLESCKAAQTISENNDFVYFAAGIHPGNVEGISSQDIPQLMQEISKFATHEKCVGIGEIGLDYYWTRETEEIQKQVFAAQLELAHQLDMSVVVHDRDAHADTMDFLKSHQPKGVVHSFSGSAEMAEEVYKLGMYIGISGVITFKNAKKLPDVVKEMPLDRFLLETDAPYLAPVPFRGKTNNSSLIYYSAEKIGEIRGISTEDVLKYALDNTLRLYNL